MAKVGKPKEADAAVRLFVIRDRTGVLHGEFFFSEKEANFVRDGLASKDKRYARSFVECLVKEAVDDPSSNLVDCEECDGTGKVEQTCNGCGVVITAKNAGGEHGLGFEGDDVCKKCEAEDDKFTKEQERKHG